MLQEKGKSVILIVDEMVKLYKIDPDRFPKTENTLGELSGLGDSRYGRVSVILCSSSWMLPILINAQARNLGYSNEFPLLKVAPNLNSTKFVTHRLPTCPPTDLDIARNILRHYGYESEDLAKTVTFLSGSVPGNIDSLLRGNWKFNEKTFDKLNVSERGKECSQLFSELMKALYRKNLRLMQQLSDDKEGINMKQVEQLDWPNEFSPLTSKEVEDVWRGIENNKKRDAYFGVEKDLHFLHDYDLVYFCPTYFGTIEQVYPSSLVKLFMFPLEGSLLLKTVEKVKEMTMSLANVNNL